MGDKKIYNSYGYGATPIVFVLIPLVLLGGFLLFSYTRDTHAPEIKAIAIKERSSQDNLSIDADQDGLKDWEEQMYGTDPHNPDTDGDGTKDGDEIAQGRDPLKKGTDDALTKQSALSSLSPSSSENTGEQQNLTKKLAEVFGTDYLIGLVQNPENQPDVDAIADKMAEITLEQPPSHVPLITANDIIVSRDATLDDIIRYVKQFNAIILNPLKPFPDTKSISDAMSNIVHTDDAARTSTAANQLVLYINQYNQFLTDIKTISVPKDFVSLHVAYLNTTIKEREALKKIKNIKNDPVTTLVGFREFMETTKGFNDLRKQYTELFLSISTPITRQ